MYGCDECRSTDRPSGYAKLAYSCGLLISSDLFITRNREKGLVMSSSMDHVIENKESEPSVGRGSCVMMIEPRGLRKWFGNHVVLDSIDLDVAAGTICAMLGPNGAGKTTMVQILSTLIGAGGGETRVAGHDLAHEPEAVRAAIGVTGQFSAVDNLLTREGNPLLMEGLTHLDPSESPRLASGLID